MLAMLAACQPAPVANRSSQDEAMANAATPAPVAQPTGVAALPAAQQLDRGFRAVFGQASPITDKDGMTVKAERLLWQDGKAVLITSSTQADACHACAGSLGVYYLRPEGDGFNVAGRFPKAVAGNGFGAAPDWSVSDKFGAAPVIYAEAGYTGQGYSCNSATLTELTQSAPRTIATVPIYYSDQGSGGSTDVTGKIGKVNRDRDFTVDYSGSATFHDLWRRGPKGYTVVGESKMQTC